MVSSPNRICPPSATCFSESSKAMNPRSRGSRQENEQKLRSASGVLVRGRWTSGSLGGRHQGLQSSSRHLQKSERPPCIGEIGFQPSGLVRNNGVPRGVALVEAISRKLVDQLKELFSFFFGQPFFCGPFDKLHTTRIDDVSFSY